MYHIPNFTEAPRVHIFSHLSFLLGLRHGHYAYRFLYHLQLDYPSVLSSHNSKNSPTTSLVLDLILL